MLQPAELVCIVQEGAVGPHPTANLEVLFTRHRFTYMLSYMTFHVAPTFSTLVHELTADQVGILLRQTHCQLYLCPYCLSGLQAPRSGMCDLHLAVNLVCGKLVQAADIC